MFPRMSPGHQTIQCLAPEPLWKDAPFTAVLLDESLVEPVDVFGDGDLDVIDAAIRLCRSPGFLGDRGTVFHRSGAPIGPISGSVRGTDTAPIRGHAWSGPDPTSIWNIISSKGD